MLKAAERLVRSYQTETTREMIADIRAETGEPNWLILHRAVLAIWLDLFYPADDDTERGE